jgi:multidrug efflux pump
VITASAKRLRPILMTSLATILGACPLTLMTGAGSIGRGQLGYVLIAGMMFSTMFTLFIVPAMYYAASTIRAKRDQ